MYYDSINWSDDAKCPEIDFAQCEWNLVIHSYWTIENYFKRISRTVSEIIELECVIFQTRYVPSVETQIKERVLSTLPLNIRDEMFLKGQPSSPPAFIAGMYSFS